jgi:hypothetical protein
MWKIGIKSSDRPLRQTWTVQSKGAQDYILYELDKLCSVNTFRKLEFDPPQQITR